MCAVSAISEYYTGTYPSRFPNNPNPFAPPIGTPGTTAYPNATDELRRDMAKVLELLDKIDKRLGDVECSDPAKEKFLKMIADGDLPN